MTARAVVLRRLVYPLVDVVRRRYNMRRHRFLERSQWWDRREMRQWQLENLKAFVQHCYVHVGLYRKRFDEVGLRPEHLQSLADIQKLPILTKQDVREYFDELMPDNIPRRRLIKAQTGGSTGIPTVFYKDALDEDWFHAGNYRVWRWYGFELGDRMILVTGWVPPAHLKQRMMVNRIKSTVLGNYTVRLLDESTESCVNVVEQINQINPVMVCGYPSRLAALARHCDGSLLNTRRLHSLYGSSELLIDHERAAIEAFFGRPLYDHYGGTESPIAAECEQRNGLHTYDESRVIEIVDSHGRPAEPGQFGRVLTTTFFRYGFPYLRFDMGDLAMVVEDKPCPCGRGLGMIGRPMGRSNRLFATAMDQPIPERTIMDHLLPLRGVAAVQCSQEADRSVKVSFVVAQGHGAGEVEQEIRTSLRTLLGNEVAVSAVAIEQIPRSRSGKREVVIGSKCQPTY